MILSFSRTTAALIAGEKSVTRRTWKERTFNTWKKREGQVFDCWSKSPHRGGKLIAHARLVSVEWEPTHLIPDSDWAAEGFEYMVRHGILLDGERSCSDLWEAWRKDLELVTAVVRFDDIRPVGED